MDVRAEKLGERNYGIDFFRIFSMLCIIIVHMLGHGGILDEVSKAKDSRFVIIWFIYVLVYGGANCFALISGFVGYHEKSSHKEIKRYLSIWIQVLFYSVVCVCIFKILHPDEITNINIIKSFLPVTTVQYWYFSSYTGVVIFAPLMNKVIEKVDVQYIVYAIVAILSIFSLYSSPTRVLGDPFGLNKGYSFLWLAIMYFFGACIKKYQVCTRVPIKKLLLVLAVLFIATLGPQLIFGLIRIESLGVWTEKLGRLFVDYMSPTIVGISIGLLMIFARIEINWKVSKLIRKITPHVFGVYLLHDNVWVRQYIISSKFDFITSLNPVLMVCTVIGVACIIFLLGILIDKIRSLLFIIFKFDKLTDWCENVIKVSYSKIEEIIMYFL